MTESCLQFGVLDGLLILNFYYERFGAKIG